LEYSHFDPEMSFKVLNAIVNIFIEDSARQKREESYGAFKFIDAQVQTYKGQLELAEKKLKDFKAGNLDGTESTVNASIAKFRTNIGELKLEIDEKSNTLVHLKRQLKEESKYLQAKGKVEAYKERMDVMNEHLDGLRLSYTDSYPDVVALQNQINDLQSEIDRVSNGRVVTNSGNENDLNPLFEDLRKRLADTELSVSTDKRRLVYLNGQLEEEYARSGRVAEKQADLSELTRDYDVTRQVYEEMLERKESARLSMTLDIEGQGVSYKIQEPAIFPLKPSGVQFFHFALLGPLVGLLVPMGLVGAYVAVDPRIRSASVIIAELPEDIELLGVIPHVNTPLTKRVLRADVIVLALVSGLGMVLYGTAVVSRMTGSI